MSKIRRSEFDRGAEDGRGRVDYVPSERVARAAARALVAANEKRGIESSAQVKKLAQAHRRGSAA
jgi:hypothetical protein